jgi:methylglutamate dehydrogenase subunit A
VLRPGAGSWTCRWTVSPIIDKTPVEGLYLNGGWCYGGFKATPASGWCFAHLIARDEMHPVASAYRLDRFASGAVIDEKGVGAQANLH